MQPLTPTSAAARAVCRCALSTQLLLSQRILQAEGSRGGAAHASELASCAPRHVSCPPRTMQRQIMAPRACMHAQQLSRARCAADTRQCAFYSTCTTRQLHSRPVPSVDHQQRVKDAVDTRQCAFYSTSTTTQQTRPSFTRTPSADHQHSRRVQYVADTRQCASYSTSTAQQTRPSFAPKPTLDIRHIAQNPGLYEQNCRDRNYPAQAQNGWAIADLRAQRAALQRDAADTRTRAKAVEKEIAKLKSSSSSEQDNDSDSIQDRVATLVAQATELRAALATTDTRDAAIEAEMLELALSLPSLSSKYTPIGSTPTQLAIEPPSPALAAQRTSHVDIGAQLDLLDFAGAAATSGWGWYILRNEAAQLEQALVSFALARLRAAGWTIVSPPSIVHAHIAAATGFQPRASSAGDATQTYALSGTTAPRVLAATAEVPLAGMQAGRELDAAALPLRTAGASRCFRAEAGARGAGARGLYRVHEFTKVEMFAWTAPAGAGATYEHFGAADTAAATAADAMLDEMVSIQRGILQELGLPHRVLEMPTADLGASACRKVDIEAFFPGRRVDADENVDAKSSTETITGDTHATEIESATAEEATADEAAWGEVTSASICGEYQSRRLGVRARTAPGSGGLAWPGTVNGTALAVPRVLAALLEVGFDAESGCVRLPECLRPWMGIEEIRPRQK